MIVGEYVRTDAEGGGRESGAVEEIITKYIDETLYCHNFAVVAIKSDCSSNVV